MKVLMVGCGAVGQVFSLFLQKAGVELGLYDRPATLEKLKLALGQGGLPLFQMPQSRGAAPLAHRLTGYQSLADEADCRRFQPDQVWFTTPSPVYYSDWFREFLGQVPSKRVVCFAPEGGRKEFFPAQVDENRLVFGGITFMAWQGDLQAGADRDAPVHFWRPPMLGLPLAGTQAACRPVEELLKKAGFNVSSARPGSPMQASVTSVMTAFVAGLELAGWSLAAFRRSPWLKRAAGASRQGILSQLAASGIFTSAFLRILLPSGGFWLATFYLPWLFPFDLEKYLKFHYLKTRDQSLALLEVFARDGEGKGRAVGDLRALLQGLRSSGLEF